ncbi:MAG: peptidoglycan/xylan/chitin deacetylase (PgdA/CDA1 family) [Bacteroidia bacterium]|jgi:peptidoglycan/xylan/chitin deacetylase (PgdA/CDA1 family)/folate-dependent phosphoribosylglycinamide formyltransferase PurN
MLTYYCTESSWPKVLNFHSVLPIINQGDPFHTWNCSIDDAIRYIDYLDTNFDIISEADYIDIQNGKGNAVGKFLITFDDGYASLHEYLKDYIRIKNIKPIIFLIAGVYSEGLKPWYISLCHLVRHSPVRILELDDIKYNLDIREERFSLYRVIENGTYESGLSKEIETNKLLETAFPIEDELSRFDEDMRFLSKTQVMELVTDGWRIGSHGFTHSPLTQVSPELLEHEIVDSKAYLEKEFGVKISSISYPNGHYNKKVTDLSSKHYVLGFTNNHISSSVNSPMHIPRMYERRIYDIHRLPKSRMGLAKSIDQYNGANSKTQKLKAITKAVFQLALSRESYSRRERGLIKGSIEHYLKLRNGVTPNKVVIEHQGLKLSNKRAFDSGPRLTILCGPQLPERATVEELCKRFIVDCVIIHNYAKKPIRVFKGEDVKYSKSSLFPHLHFHNGAQKKLLGHGSLAWFVQPLTEVYSTSDINDESVEGKVKSINSDFVFVFGTGIIKSNLLHHTVPMVNLHWGLSPYYRGSHTLRWPIFNNELEAIAITMHKLTSRLDGGGIVLQKKIKIDGSETVEEIEYKAAVEGTNMIISIIEKFNKTGTIPSTPQDLTLGRLYRSREYTKTVDATVRRLLLDGVIFKPS